MENIIEWATQFKQNHRCGNCPFIKNDADIGVGIIYDCDRVCAMEISEIVEYSESMLK